MRKRKNLTPENMVKKWADAKPDKNGWKRLSHDVWNHDESGAQAARWYQAEIDNERDPRVTAPGYYASKPGLVWIGPFPSLEVAQNIALYLERPE